jgi:hypothetical protein
VQFAVQWLGHSQAGQPFNGHVRTPLLACLYVNAITHWVIITANEEGNENQILVLQVGVGGGIQHVKLHSIGALLRKGAEKLGESRPDLISTELTCYK